MTDDLNTEDLIAENLIAEDLRFPDLRAQFASLADAGAPKLTSAARARILDQVELQGPELAAMPVPRSRWALAGGVGVGLAAAAAIGLWFVSTSEPTAPVAAGPACANWDSASATPMDGQLDLGRRGSAEFEGDVHLDAIDGCTTELQLQAGRVEVRADDLGGGSLRVVAGEIAVEVWGTRFSVARDGGQVEVDVEEGHVVVSAPGEREIHLHGGERWSRGERRAELDPTPVASETVASETAASETVASETVAAPVLEQPVPEADRLSPHGTSRPSRQISDRERLAMAERLWSGSERDAARRIFRQVGVGRGALAEAAWVRLARLELRGGEARNALVAARQQRERFPRSHLGAEALFIQADAARRLGDTAGVRRALRVLGEQYPDSPQARATR